MNYVGKLLSNFKGFYNEINSATLTGAIDIVVVQQEDGSYLTSPWHVRFGKLGVLRSREKVVDVEVNGQPAANIQMKLGEAGEAFFVLEASHTDEVPAHLATSPLPDSLELMERGLRELHEVGQKLETSLDPCLQSTIINIDPEGIASFEVKAESESEVPAGSESEVNQAGSENEVPVGSETKASDGPENELPDGSGAEIPAGSTSKAPVGSVLESRDGSVKDFHPQMAEMVSSTGHDLTKELKIVIEGPDQQNQGCDLEASSAHFCPVSVKRTSETGIQTDMSAAEVETRASKLGLSTESCKDLEMILSERQPSPHPMDNSKLPSFVRMESEMSKVKKTVKEKRKRRRKKSPASNIHDLPRHTSNRKNSNLDVLSTESGSSRDTPEEALFDLELSEDETDNAEILMTTMGRTVSMPLIDHKHARTDEWANSQYAAAFHPFSDGDLTPLVSPIGSRPPTPKSDTEYEITKFEATSQTHLTGDNLLAIDSVSWRWGELPENCESATNLQDTSEDKAKEEAKTSRGLFEFMRKTRKMRHNPEQEGIYLDDLNLTELDPEVAALYLYQTKSTSLSHRNIQEEDNDNESGRGASLPQSPLTVDGATHMANNSSCMSELSLSLCGGLKESDGMIPHDKFLQFLVTYDEFCANPSLLSNPNLVVKMGEKYYNWQIAGPLVMSVLAFQRPLPEQAVEELVKAHMPKKETQRRRGWMWWSRGTGSEAQDTKDKSLGKNASSAPNTPQKPGKAEKKSKRKVKSDHSSGDESDTSVRSEPKPLMVNTDMGAETVSVATQMSPPVSNWHREFCKTLKLSSDKIATLNLQPGNNEVTFSVTTQYQGTTACSANIYLWKWDDRVIISDIDGTITKSDVLGQFLPMIGKDWSQVGIANLYSLIEKNGYKFLYLSARAIGQSKITRDYLRSIRQGQLSLPDGPLLLSPSSLISAFHKEVIERRPQDFKISCLRDIKALFPQARNPFHSGFGNKVNDVWSYQAVNIPISRIFTVNHRGELRHEMTCTFQSTYTKMTDTVDHLFPPLKNHPELGKIPSGNFPAADEYSNFTYWRDPLPDIGEELGQILGKK